MLHLKEWAGTTGGDYIAPKGLDKAGVPRRGGGGGGGLAPWRWRIHLWIPLVEGSLVG